MVPRRLIDVSLTHDDHFCVKVSCVGRSTIRVKVGCVSPRRRRGTKISQTKSLCKYVVYGSVVDEMSPEMVH